MHLLRDIHELTEDYPDDSDVHQWADAVYDLYEEAKAYIGPSSHLQPGEKEKERIAKQAYCEDKLRSLCSPWVRTDRPMRKLCSRIVNYLQELFVFIRFEGIPSDNNGAERILRHTPCPEENLWRNTIIKRFKNPIHSLIAVFYLASPREKSSPRVSTPFSLMSVSVSCYSKSYNLTISAILGRILVNISTRPAKTAPKHKFYEPNSKNWHGSCFIYLGFGFYSRHCSW